MVKNLPADARDMGLIPGSGRCPGEGNGYPLQWVILTWRIPSIEESGGLPSLGSKRVAQD